MVDVPTTSGVSATLTAATAAVNGVTSVAFARPPGVGVWVPLNIMQEMRVWVLLAGHKNHVVYEFMTADFGFVSLNMPVA